MPDVKISLAPASFPYKRKGKKIYVRKKKNMVLWRTFPSQKKARRKMENLRFKWFYM